MQGIAIIIIDGSAKSVFQPKNLLFPKRSWGILISDYMKFAKMECRKSKNFWQNPL